MDSDEFLDVGRGDRIGRRDLATSQLDGAGVDVTVQLPALDRKAQQLTQRRLTQVKGMERQRIWGPGWTA